ncbi:UDP-N-acetylmuramoylalanyl-D-glutamyl-2,6-diaminopimelate--D-alanyl-D-alanine ligase [Kiloniella laminariae]|uniref:UDP-N-acetylmuramoyl-tripeptide--D-alanyl-D-alanine ligase n=1 Tax=Kiloniella laminariae TaxID=454162 RepID=A0ABT4LH16_9PROT|nr:UDP-N-acetylmuramoylalanyl-D-glutamyl-2,6-diaminopimelate--D-alanyl-D-alanine ligase [Kiloniella laminariae]MCZ4279297.1 UDP-N-acetylmuramoylalanyl-D-glutamyl-2,6-diaminopimelate--D-alanyl-D-alanine ligase [Kiloniella laminariae]
MTRAVLWTAEDAASATGGQNTRDWQATGLSLNTRTLEKGDLFFALQGPNFDGHDYVAQAFEKGAAAAVVHNRPEHLGDDVSLLLVDDTLGALNRLGASARSNSSAKFIGVTGSVGKTSIKEALRHCLSKQAITAASAASFNNHWGVPLSLARMPRDSVYAINEMGMNSSGEIRELTKLVRPDVAIISTIEAAHFEFFKSLEEIAQAKCEIFESMSSNGVAILNRDHPLYDLMAESAQKNGLTNIIGFGENPDAQARLIGYELFAEYSRVEADICGEILDFTIANPGFHWIINSLAVLAAVKAVGADVHQAATDLSSVRGLPGRGEKTMQTLSNGESFELIDDSYNANPASVRASINVLTNSMPGPSGRRIAVLGDMLELGKKSRKLHADLAGPINDSAIDLVFTCGQQMKALHDALPAEIRGIHKDNSQELASCIAQALRSGDVVSVKGSLGSRMSVIIEALKSQPTPDRGGNV